MSKSRDIADSAATINYIDTVTSNVQDQIDNLDPVPTNIAGGSAGTIPYQTAPDTTAMLAVGTAGQVLQTNGAGAPSWVTPAGGAMVFLSEIIVSSAATADIETTFDSTYDEYVLVATNVKSAFDSQQLRCRLKINDTYQTTVGYYNHQNQSRSNSASYSATNKNGDTEIVLATTTGSASTESIHFRMHISNPTSTTRHHSIDYQGAQVDANGASSFVNGVGHYNTTGALTGVRIYCASGNLSGTFRLYGIAKA